MVANGMAHMTKNKIAGIIDFLNEFQ